MSLRRREKIVPMEYSKDALVAQQRYGDGSTRGFKLYSRRLHDFGPSPNADQCIKIDVRIILTFPSDRI